MKRMTGELTGPPPSGEARAPEPARWQPAVRLLMAALVACLVLPMVLLTYAAWSTDRELHGQAEQRIGVSLDVMTQHTLKVFQTAELALYTIRLLTEGMSDAQILAQEPQLHARLNALSANLPVVQSLWIIGRDGHPLASSLVSPLPPLDVSDRDYYQVLKRQPDSLFIGRTARPKLPGPPFFFFGRGRVAADGTFDGIIDVSLKPSDFAQLYSELDPNRTGLHALVRSDGVPLARFPLAASELPGDMTQSGLLRAIATRPDDGRYHTRSMLDGVDRIVGYRRVPGYDVYVVAGIETRSIAAAWRATVGSHLVFGVPATLLLLVTLAIAIQRTRHLALEAERRQSAEAALNRTRRLEALGQLTGGVAHDFNNLLTIVRGSADTLGRRTEQAAAAERRALAAIETAVDRGAALTRQLLTFASRQALAVEVIDLGQHVARFAEDMLRRSLRGDIRCSVQTPPAPCIANVDPGELDLALLNIAVNARDAMPEGGDLTLEMRRVTLAADPVTDGLVGAFIAISVRDTGAGIAPEVLPRVFEPFFTTKEAGRGSGLGLSQVYGFARQSGGTVTVTSTPGRGTEVVLYLPVCDAAPRAAAAAPAAAQDSGDGRRILLVEDDAAVADVTRSLLLDLGFRVEIATSAAEALERLRDGPNCDLLLSDVVMPGTMNGIALAQRVRKQYPHLPVVLASGFTIDAEAAIRDGLAFLQKPYRVDRLREVLAASGQPVAAQPAAKADAVRG